MATLTIRIDETLANKIAEIVTEYRADVQSGGVTGFDWTDREELAEVDEILTAISDAKTDLVNQ